MSKTVLSAPKRWAVGLRFLERVLRFDSLVSSPRVNRAGNPGGSSPREDGASLEFATLEWVDWFNIRRLLEPIGDVPTAEFEANYWSKEGSDERAPLRDPSLR
jgi:transposase InsO family protein